MFRHVRARKLVAYVDGELPEAELRAVEEHLMQCSSCYARVLKQQRTVAVLREWATTRRAPAVRGRSCLSRLQWASRIGLRATDFKPAQGVRPAVFGVAVLLAFLLVYGVQSLVTDFLARRQVVGDPRITAYVEDHLGFEQVHRAVASIGESW